MMDMRLWILLVYFGTCFALSKNSRLQSRSPDEILKDAPPYHWVEEYYKEMPIDHFSFTNPQTFSLRYFFNLIYYTPGGPIFFYTGNEGWLESFTVNTGFMWDNAPEYKAALVFAEHRYYGKSLPFGNQSFSSLKNLGYLSSEQALADFAEIITFMKNKRIPNAVHSPVIAFGGSYGGMLAAWMRVKYPHLVDGQLCCSAIAASAPIFWFQNAGLPEDSYSHIVSRTFKLSGCSLKAIVSSIAALFDVAKTQEGIDYINDVFHLSGTSKVENSSDVSYLRDMIYNVMNEAAMVDYPYSANFLKKLPAWPVKEMCKRLSNKTSDPREQIKALYPIFNVWYNGTGDVRNFCLRGKECGDLDDLGAMNGWNWQSCTEMVMPMCSNGPPSDVFVKDCPYKIDGARDGCLNMYKHLKYDDHLFRPNWILENYGRDFPTATNIVFSNGWLDPWSAGGWRLEPTTEGSLISLIIEEGAHHYDLRANHPNDTPFVLEARRIEKLHITRWIKEAMDKPKQQFKKAQPNTSHNHHSGHNHQHFHRHAHRHHNR
ncbi:putative effector protein [Aphelenchoides besseyi]|nr:putative effector protein [Aphelenchoides besseyi]